MADIQFIFSSFKHSPSDALLALSCVGGFLWIISTLSRCCYNLFLHPLRHVPGPKSAAFSELKYIRALIQGSAVRDVYRYHQRYGPVVRVAPNEVSFTSEESWKAIYGFKTGQKEGYEKDMHFFPPPLNGVPGIVLAHGADHGRQRRIFSHAFSDNALRQQLPLIMKYVNLLIERLHEQCQSKGGGRINAVTWYNYITFDVIADLTFGDSFHCLENSDYHPLVTLIYAALKSQTFLNAQRRLNWLKYFIQSYIPKTVLQKRKDLMEFTIRNVANRLSMETERADFLAHVSSVQGPKGMTRKEIESTALIFLIAGSETTATTLSGATYLALSHPQVMEKLKNEVRSAFKTEDDITIDAINNKLPYMLAVLNETLRIYPPVPTGFGRTVPSGGDTIAGYYIPEGTSVYVSQYAANHSPHNFVDPDSFFPERWLGDARFEKDNRAITNPFSIGPRACLGKNLAYLEMRLILARMIWNFDIELCEESREGWLRQPVYTLWDKRPLLVKLTAVQRVRKQ